MSLAYLYLFDGSDPFLNVAARVLTRLPRRGLALAHLAHDVPTQTLTSGHLFPNKTRPSIDELIQWSTLGFMLFVKCHSDSAIWVPSGLDAQIFGRKLNALEI